MEIFSFLHPHFRKFLVFWTKNEKQQCFHQKQIGTARDTHAKMIQTNFYTKQSNLKIEDWNSEILGIFWKIASRPLGITEDASQISSKSAIFKSPGEAGEPFTRRQVGFFLYESFIRLWYAIIWRPLDGEGPGTTRSRGHFSWKKGHFWWFPFVKKGLFSRSQILGVS